MSQQQAAQEVVNNEVQKFVKGCKSGTSGGLRALRRLNEFVRLRYPILNATQAQLLLTGPVKENDSSMGKALLRMAVFHQSSRRAQGTVSTLAISTLGLLLATELEQEGGTRALSRLLSGIGQERIALLSLDVHVLSYDEDQQEAALQLVQLFATSGTNPAHILGDESGRPMKLYREWSRTKPVVNTPAGGAGTGFTEPQRSVARLNRSASTVNEPRTVNSSATAPARWADVNLSSPLEPLAVSSDQAIKTRLMSFQSSFKSGQGIPNATTSQQQQSGRAPTRSSQRWVIDIYIFFAVNNHY
jgi:hypothetical protein